MMLVRNCLASSATTRNSGIALKPADLGSRKSFPPRRRLWGPARIAAPYQL
jgi:hypothetical protein